MRNIKICARYILIGLFVLACLHGCGYYAFDPKYYEIKKYAKRHSGTYALDRRVYEEILQKRKANAKAALAYQRQIEENLSFNQDWIANKEAYMKRARDISDYNVAQNAKAMFVQDQIDLKFKDHMILSNNAVYSTFRNFSSIKHGDSLVSQDILDRISAYAGAPICAYKCVIYPEYLYTDEHGETSVVSVVVLYLYTSADKVYQIARREGLYFANGVWRYASYDNVFYLDSEDPKSAGSNMESNLESNIESKDFAP